MGVAAQWRHVEAELAAIDTRWLTQQLTLRDQLHAQQATLVDTAADLTRHIDAPRTTLQRLRQRDTINSLRDQLEATLQRRDHRRTSRAIDAVRTPAPEPPNRLWVLRRAR